MNARTVAVSVAYAPEALSRSEAARYVGLGETSFMEAVREGEMPEPRFTDRIGRPLWAISEVLAYLRALPVAGEHRRRTEAEPSVYFVRMHISPYVKIGFANYPRFRLSELQTGNPERLVMLGTTPGDFATERRFHQALCAHRSNGEWFHIGPWFDHLLDGLAGNDDADALIKRLEALVQ